MRGVSIGLAVSALLAAPPVFAKPATTPAELADALLAADRAFSAASAKTDSVTGISAMFAEDVAMIAPGAGFTKSKAEAVEVLRANPKNLTAKAEWTPVRVGLSADGIQGFTMGYMVITDADGLPRKGKYLAYWVRKPEGWRIASYKRQPQGEGAFSSALMPAVLPARPVAPGVAQDEAAKSIDAAERGFSDDAQVIGLGPAFCKHGALDATNLGGPRPEIVSGVENVCREVGGKRNADGSYPPSPVAWAPDKVLVASSGDLGITWGFIRRHGDTGQGIPYTTVWVRPGPGGKWKYIAE